MMKGGHVCAGGVKRQTKGGHVLADGAKRQAIQVKDLDVGRIKAPNFVSQCAKEGGTLEVARLGPSSGASSPSSSMNPQLLLEINFHKFILPTG